MSGMTAEELELRLEYQLLLAERDALLQEADAAVVFTARATTARNSATLTERSLLQAYLAATRCGDEDACAAAEAEMRKRVETWREREEETRKVLAAVRSEAIVVRRRCRTLTPRWEC